VDNDDDGNTMSSTASGNAEVVASSNDDDRTNADCFAVTVCKTKYPTIKNRLLSAIN
jgi:hypothetical protein